MKGSRLRHRDWGLDIIWGVTGTCKRRPAMQVTPESQRGGGSRQAAAWRQERAEGPAGQLAPLGGPGFKTKINLGEPDRRKERNKQISRASACVSPNQQRRPGTELPRAPGLLCHLPVFWTVAVHCVGHNLPRASLEVCAGPSLLLLCGAENSCVIPMNTSSLLSPAPPMSSRQAVPRHPGRSVFSGRKILRRIQAKELEPGSP